MQKAWPNHFERAFLNWLQEQRVQFVQVDQSRRAALARSKFKSFDFLVYSQQLDRPVVIAEIKGRRFTGTSLAGLKSLPCWVTLDDIAGLAKWEEVLGPKYQAMFVFIYELVHIDIDADGRNVFEYDGRRYFQLAISLRDYQHVMKPRSQKWHTVTAGADDFRKYACNFEDLIVKT